MDVIRDKPNWKNSLLGWIGHEEVRPSLSGMDRVVAKKPLWTRLAIPTAICVAMAGVAMWALSGAGGSVYRVPLDQLTIGTVSSGPFEDFIAVRGAVAPLITDYLTTAQGGTVKEVLVEDGTAVKKGQPLIILSN